VTQALWSQSVMVQLEVLLKAMRKDLGHSTLLRLFINDADEELAKRKKPR
jgi:hypothetical protein